MKHIPATVKSKYEILGKIGEGSYGVVLKARKKDTNTIVAIKHFKQASMGHCTDMDIIERELKVLQSLRYEHVVELTEWFRHKKQCFLVFEYVEWNMLQVLQEHPDGLPLDQVRRLSYQLFSAINWCHTHEIIHRDIKPENLLISKDFVLKLCDFGFARFCNTQTTADFYTDYVATRWYRSPELLIGSPYGKPVDIWACGCIMAELATGQALFAGASDIDQLYRIQKCLGPLPPKYVEAMKTNPKFDGLKFPAIHHLDTLERQFSHLFPQDVMSVFEGTLHLYAPERLRAENCVRHAAFAALGQKPAQRRSRRPRPKTVVGIIDTTSCQYDRDRPLENFKAPFLDSRMNDWNDDQSDVPNRQRSPTSVVSIPVSNIIEVPVLGPSSLVAQPPKFRSHTQRSHRSRSSHQQQAKAAVPPTSPHSSSSEEHARPAVINPISSNDSSDADDDDDDDNDPNNIFLNHSRSRRQFVKNTQDLPLALLLEQAPPSREEQHPPAPPTSSPSKGALLRPRQLQQRQTGRVSHASSRERDRKLKRFTMDPTDNRWPQQVPESNVYRVPVVITPGLNSNAHGVLMNNHSSHNLACMRATPHKEESHSDILQRPRTRDLVRSRTVECHPSVETASNFQRVPSRQTVISQHQMIPDLMDQTDVETTISGVQCVDRQLEPAPMNSRYTGDVVPRKSIYTSDGHSINTNNYTSSFTRTFFQPTKADFAQVSKVLLAPQRESSHDLIKSTRALLKQNKTVIPKSTLDMSRRQTSNPQLFGVYPYTRTAARLAPDALLPTSVQRQQSIRLPSTRSRLHDR